MLTDTPLTSSSAPLAGQAEASADYPEMLADERWSAVVRRDARHDGRFVFAVASTAIYCRPSCPARRPQRNRVTFFETPAQAEAAGYRACRRCRPRDAAGNPALELVRRASALIEEADDAPPTLGQLAGSLGVSPGHLQRTFKRLTGVSPRQYADTRRVGKLKQSLQNGDSVTDALYGAGYGSSSRLYESAGPRLGMTPATYRARGGGLHVRFTIVGTAVGRMLVAATERGICAVRLGESDEALEEALRTEFRGATIERDDARLSDWTAAIVSQLEGGNGHSNLPLDVRATAFQRLVWDALRAIPYGTTRSYAEVARSVGQPAAVRAVARACATNPVALLVPCHRVVRGDGSAGGYRWRVDRKRAILDVERRASESP